MIPWSTCPSRQPDTRPSRQPWWPRSYTTARDTIHGKLLVRNEPLASILQEAMESYASGRLQTQAEVRRFLEQHPQFPRNRRGEVVQQRVSDVLTRVLYAGYIEVPEWGIHRVPAKHEALVSYTTYQAIQARLNGVAKVPARADLADEFPLRGFVTCACCERPMTACWSKGRNQRYPYYFCFTKDCAAYRKSIRCEKIEGEFGTLLSGLRPTPNLFAVAAEMFRDLWDMRVASMKTQGLSLQREHAAIDHKVGQLPDRIVDAESETLVTAYERRIRELEERKITLSERIKSCGRPLQSFNETFRTAFDFLSNPCKLWASDRLEDRRAVLKLVFADRLAYHHKEGFRTAETTLPFRVLGNLQWEKREMARPRGGHTVQRSSAKSAT